MSELNATQENTQLIIINKGTGAGGANTNYYGKKFEEKTNNQQRLLEIGYSNYSIHSGMCNPQNTQHKRFLHYLI